MGVWAVQTLKRCVQQNNEVEKKHLAHGISGGNFTMIY